MANSPIDAGIDDSSHLLNFHRSLSHPSHYRVFPKPPTSADLEARNLALPDQFVNRSGVDPQ
jgi:hypothetical protein